MALTLRRATNKAAPAPCPSERKPMSPERFKERQFQRLMAASAAAARVQNAATNPAPAFAAGPVPQRAQGGPIEDGKMSPDGEAAAMLREQGVDQPSIAAVHHLAAELAGNRDPVRMALAMAQASHADLNGYALDTGRATHALNSVAPTRPAYALGGLVHPAVAQALAAMYRPHFDDGGGEGGGDSGGSSGGDARSGGGGNSSSGDGGSSSGGDGSSSSSGSNGSSSGDNSSAGSGGDSASSGAGGGVGGFGGGNGGSDGYGGGASSAASTSSAPSGGMSDAATGGADTSSAPSSGGSDAATGPASAGPGAVGGYGSATSGAVGSIGGSVGASAAGGFSNPGAPATGGFGSFGAGPMANNAAAGMTGAQATASSMSGMTAGQSASAEAASGGDPGEDGTGSGGVGVNTAGAFGSFGPAPASPYGGMANAETAFGGTQASDLAGSSLSPAGQQLGQIGLGGGVPGAMAASPDGFASPGAYGLSSTTAGVTPGFDNFSSVGNVAPSAPGDFAAQSGLQQSMLGPQGWTGFGEGLDPSVGYGTLAGIIPGSVLNAMQGDLPGKEAAQTDLGDLAQGFTPDYSGFQVGPDGKPTFNGNAGAIGEAAQSLAGLGTTFGGVPAAAPSGPAPGVNADGDPTAVDGTSALTIHGDYAPGTAMMAGSIDPSTIDGVPQVHTFASVSPSYAQTVGRPINAVYNAATLSNDTGVTSMPAFATMGLAPQTPGMGPMSLGTPAASGPAISDSQVFAARQAIINGTATDQDRATVAGYLAQQNGGVDGTGSAASATPAQVASATPGVPVGGVFGVLHTIEGGKLNGQVDPNNPAHYGPAQFDQPTFSDTIANHPEIGLSPGASMFGATAQQYAAATQAHWSDIQASLTAAGIDPTPANTYLGWNRGITGAINAINAGPDASLAAAGITPAIQRANPSIYGGSTTVGQVQAHLASMFSGVSNPGSGAPAPSASIPTGGFSNLSPGAASGMDTTDTAATTANPGISPPSTYADVEGTAPTTQTVSTPAPYGVTPTTATTLNAFSMSATPANAMAAETLGFGVASQVMNGAPSDPVSAAGISDATVAANPSLFSGVKTIGDLQANISKAAETAGTTMSTVTTPGTPAQPGALPGYSYSPGAASGLDSTDPAAAQVGITAPGVYDGYAPGAPTATAPTAGVQADAPATSPAPSHLSVPVGATNFGANLALAGLGGPIGGILAGVNGVSGLLGGPTIGSMLNSALASSGSGQASSPLGGQGDNSTSPGQSTSSDMPAPYGPSVGSDGTSAAAGASSGASGAASGDGTTIPPLVIHALHQAYRLPQANTSGLYDPLQDPAVVRALAAMRG